MRDEPGAGSPGLALDFGETEDEITDELPSEPELTSGLSLPSEMVERIRTGSFPSVRVRRITPTECERLMGLDDGWTIASPEMIAKWGRSISTSLDGTSSAALSRSLSSSGLGSVSEP